MARFFSRLALSLWGALPAMALAGQVGEVIKVCYNYGCQMEAPVTYSDAQLSRVAERLRLAENADEERLLLALVMGKLYAWAGEQTPIRVDRGGNMADDSWPGSMDCIDHSTTAVRVLEMLERRGLLRFHHVIGRVKRVRFLIADHWAAEIEETPVSGNEREDAKRHYVVDTWFRDNGKPAVVMPLSDWKSGEGPDL